MTLTGGIGADNVIITCSTLARAMISVGILCLGIASNMVVINGDGGSITQQEWHNLWSKSANVHFLNCPELRNTGMKDGVFLHCMADSLRELAQHSVWRPSFSLES
eukprot:Filipodium_phascolosomae@DN971_c0_g1_i1.p1